MFLGYSTYHKGYKCLHPSRRIYIACSVCFDENDFHFIWFPCSNSHPDYSSTETSFSPCHQWIPKFDCPSPINVGMTVSGALQNLESTTSSPSSFGSSQNNNQGNSSGLSLTSNIEISSIDLS